MTDSQCSMVMLPLYYTVCNTAAARWHAQFTCRYEQPLQSSQLLACRRKKLVPDIQSSVSGAYAQASR